MGDTLQNKIQKLIDQIEFAVNNCESNSEIIDYVARKMGYSKSDIGTIFSYISDQSMISYIRNRKLTMAYNDLKSNRATIADIAFKYGYSDQAAFTKAFKNLFGTTPKKLTNVDDDKLQNRLTIKMILSGDEKMEERQYTYSNNIDNGNAQFFNFYKQIRDLSAVYGFNDELTNICIALKEKYEFKLKDAFEFLDEYIISHSMKKDAIHSLRDLSINDDYIKLYKDYSLSLHDIDIIISLIIEHNMKFDDLQLKNIDFLINKLEFSAFHATIIMNCAEYLGLSDLSEDLSGDQACYSECAELIHRVSIPFYSWDYEEYHNFVSKQVNKILEEREMLENCYYDSFNINQDEFDYEIKSNIEEKYYQDKLDRLEEQLFYGYDNLEDDYN